MTIVARRLAAGALCLLAGTGLLAQGHPAERYALDAEAIARALHADGFEVQTGAVHLPMPLTTAVEHPGLELTGAERLPDGRMRVRLHCRKQSECLPFSVTLDRGQAHSHDAHQKTVALASPEPRVALLESAASPNPSALPADTSRETQAQAAEPDMRHSNRLDAAQVNVIQVGARLTMLMEDGHLHIHIPVIALDSSSTGREVRVASLDHKHVYRATVVDATTVRGIVE